MDVPNLSTQMLDSNPISSSVFASTVHQNGLQNDRKGSVSLLLEGES